MKIIITEEQLKELYKSTYNSAAAKSVEQGNDELALDSLHHSNEMGIPELNGDNSDGKMENYMFLQNLKTIKTHVDMLLSKSPKELDEILKEHDWASDHIATAKDDVEEVCNFFTNGYVNEGKKVDKRIKCSNCDWSWKESESDPEDLYVCHECGKDNSPSMVEDKGRPCWKGYEDYGTKMKNGKEVPNCVPIKEGVIEESEYQGRKVKLNKPTRGDIKKFKVYVKNGKGNVVKVNFGHGGTSAKKRGEKTMRIRKSDPKARKSFRARHNCDNPGPKWKARYWSCKKW